MFHIKSLPGKGETSVHWLIFTAFIKIQLNKEKKFDTLSLRPVDKLFLEGVVRGAVGLYHVTLRGVIIKKTERK